MSQPLNQQTRRRARRRRGRAGATTIEMAVSLLTFLTLVLGMLDLGIAVFQQNVLANAARQLARQAIVHGALADQLGPWGPAGYSGTGSSSDAIATAVEPYLTGLNPSQVSVEVAWLAGSNTFGAPVQVTLSTPWQPMMFFIFGNPTYTLSASSDMLVAH